MDKTKYLELKKQLETAKENVRYCNCFDGDDSMLRYYIEQLQDISTKILLALAEITLSPEDFKTEKEDYLD